MRALLSALLALLPAAWAHPLHPSLTSPRVDLYPGDPHIVHLDNSSFTSALLDQPHAWAVEFYNDWCGHCRRFAPVWSAVAAETTDWGSVLKVAAVNCARERNQALCRQYGIQKTPTVKMFGPGATVDSRGTPYQLPPKPHKSEDIVIGLSTFVGIVQRNLELPGWPDLTPFNGSVDQLMALQPSPLQALVVDSADSAPLGRLVQLDLSSHRQMVSVRHAAKLPGGIERFTTVNAPLPLLLVFRNGSLLLSSSAAADSSPRQLFSGQLRQLAGVAAESESTTPAATESSTLPPADTSVVWLTDMENALLQSLRSEIAGEGEISGSSLLALREFLATLAAYYPGKASTRAALSHLHSYTAAREGVSGQQLLGQLQQLPLPAQLPWRACRGSWPGYRGYTCGLWTLFHALTVEALAAGEKSVLPAIHGYVRHFFSCKECSQHFQTMSAEDGLFNVTSAADSVLWLWRAHNKVNARLAGDATEDPAHPKLAFPTREQCPACATDGVYNDTAVLQFLRGFYGKENIRREEGTPGVGGPKQATEHQLAGTGEVAPGAPAAVVPAKSHGDEVAGGTVSKTALSGESSQVSATAGA